VRHGDRRDGDEPFGHLGRGGPGHCGAPVVPDQVHPLCAAGVDQRAEIADEFGDPVVAAAWGAGTRAIAALVGRKAAVAPRGESVDDGVPAVVVLREAVQQHDDRHVGRPGVADVEGQPVVGVVIHTSSMSHRCAA